MDTMERDPLYIAGKVKLIRKMHRLTQENLADAAGLSSRTIEKVESGRHRPDEQTLRSIARAVKLDVSYFVKPSPGQEERQKIEMLDAMRKMVVVPISPIQSVSDFLSSFAQRDAFRIDTSAVVDDEALDPAAELADWIRDCADIWEDCYMSQRLEYAREFIKLCEQIEKLNYRCYMGAHRQQLKQKDRSRMVFIVGLMTILPKDAIDGTRYAMVHLEGAWESMEEDRIPLE